MAGPSTARPAVPGVGRLGLLEPTAGADLKTLGWDNVDSVSLLWALSRAADPDLALGALVTMQRALGHEWAQLDMALRTDLGLRGRLFGLIGASIAFADHLIAHPQAWRLLQVTGLPDASSVAADMMAVVTSGGEVRTGSDVVAALRLRYRERLMVLAALDLAATVEDEPALPFRRISAALTDLADAASVAAFAVSVATVCPQHPPRLAVVAMGKCGGRELNYVSDVDVVFVAEPADDHAHRVAVEFMRIAKAAFFDIDAGLRPEGKQGPLVRTLDSHVAYYRRWATTWEFQALLKARPLAGDVELGRAYCEALVPQVWTACERADFVADVQHMRRRVENSVPEPLRERQLKLGSGGLRDVEFAVQLLQMVHGRTDESLQVPGTVEALAALSAGGYVGRDDAANLTASYEFLRLLEHRLQLRKLQRTHTLPPLDDEEGLRRLARAAHMRPDGRHDATGVLVAEIKRNSVRVRRLHVKLFYRPLLESVARLSTDTVRLSSDAAIRRLAALGYQDPKHALHHLAALTPGVSRRGRIQTLLLPTLLGWLADTPDPDQGLLSYRRVSEALAQTSFLRELRDEGAIAQRLMIVLGTSAYLPDLLINAPETLRLYADGPRGPLLCTTDPDDVARGIVAAAARHRDPVRAVDAARSLRRRELARVASADVLGMVDVPYACWALSSVWVAVLEAALSSVIAASEGERGEPAPADIAVIGMGRLGGLELGYGSDADVLFVCDPRPGTDDADAVAWAGRVAEEVRRVLGSPSTDPPLQLDTGLRPEGRNGPVVRTLAAYEAYYRQWARPWEIQALLRAHQVAGDNRLGFRFLHVIDPIRYPADGVSADGVREIRRIKARMDAERLPRGADPMTHTKLGRGGLADVEWTVQLLQLQHAHELPGLRNTATLETLDVIETAGLLTSTDVALLRDAWLTATKARNALVLVRGKPSDQLPGPGRVLTAVARIASGTECDGSEFRNNYLRITRRARVVVDRVFGG